jgi:hypothetical protein
MVTRIGKKCHGGLRCLFLPFSRAVIDTKAIIAHTQLIYLKMHELVAKTHKIHALLRRAVLQNNNNNNNTRNAWLASNNCYNFAAALARAYRGLLSARTQHQK